MLGSKLDIMQPGWLDLIFKNRNHAYGAYELRSHNARVTNMALLSATCFFVFVLASPTIYNRIMGLMPKADAPVRIVNVNLLPPPPIEKNHPLPPPPKPAVAIPQHSTIAFPPPIVKPDAEAQKDPPTEEQLKVADPGQKDVKGSDNGTVIIDEQAGTVNSPGVTEETNDRTVFTAVEIAPTFPGGEEAFAKFLETHIKYPEMARENNISGRAFISFVVERDGSLTDIKSVRDPGSGLGEEAIRVLKISPHWKPGIQNGRPVRVAYTVPVNFTLNQQ